LFGATSQLYATLGQAGGAAFVGLDGFASFPSNEMRPTALRRCGLARRRTAA